MSARNFFYSRGFQKLLKTILLIGWLFILISFISLLITDTSRNATAFFVCGISFFSLRLLIPILMGPALVVIPDWSLVYPELAGVKGKRGKNFSTVKKDCSSIIPTDLLLNLFSFVIGDKKSTSVLYRLLYISYLFLLLGGTFFLLNGISNFNKALLIGGGLIYAIILLMLKMRSAKDDWTLVYPELDIDNETNCIDVSSANISEDLTLNEWKDHIKNLQSQLNDTMNEVNQLKSKAKPKFKHSSK